jgi:hypothetical protein
MIIVCAVLEAVLDVIWSRLAQETEGAGGRLIEQCFSGEYYRASCLFLGSTYKGQVCGLH